MQKSAVPRRWPFTPFVTFLLGRGVPKRHPDDPQWATPCAWARRRGHDAIAQLLA